MVKKTRGTDCGPNIHLTGWPDTLQPDITKYTQEPGKQYHRHWRGTDFLVQVAPIGLPDESWGRSAIWGGGAPLSILTGRIFSIRSSMAALLGPESQYHASARGTVFRALVCIW